MNKIYVVGMGPGSDEYITLAARRAIEEAQILVGGRRWLDATRSFNKEQILLSSLISDTIEIIKKERVNKRLAVLVSGDTGIHSLLPRLREELGRDALEVIPGISSIQLAFARLGRSWENARILSLHGRKMDGIEKEIADFSLCAVFCDKINTPANIAVYLRDKGIKSRTVYFCHNLSYPDERIIKTDLNHLGEISPSDNFFLIIEKESNE